MNIEIVTPPPVYPVTLTEIYAWLRLDPSGSPPAHADDTMLTALIAACTDEAERATCRALIEQTIRLTTGYWGIQGIELRRPPFIGLVAVRYYDLDNVLQALAGTNYTLVTGGMVPKIQLATGQTWPQIYAREDAVQIEYTAGYLGTGSPVEDYRVNVPEAIKTGIKMGVQALYDNMKPDDLDRLNMAKDAIYAMNKVYSFSTY